MNGEPREQDITLVLVKSSFLEIYHNFLEKAIYTCSDFASCFTSYFCSETNLVKTGLQGILQP